MKEITLTQEKIAIVDDEDYEKLKQFEWYAWNYNKNGFYAYRSSLINNKRQPLSMHREIIGAVSGYCVDHVNGNGLDNRKVNLRFCTRQQNQFNRKKCNKNNKLGIKGVIWDKTRRKFRTQIKINRKLINLGRYNTLFEATEVHRQAEEKYFGTFARNST